MATEIKALHDKVICKVVKHDNVTASGIILPDGEGASTAKQDYVVTSVGDQVTTIEVGDSIACHERGGMDYMHSGTIYKILKYEEIYGIIKGGE